MKVTLGKKIGGGFALLLLLTLMLGVSMQYAIESGLTTSHDIADDRVPRFVANSDLQNYLLLAGYRIRLYFQYADPAYLISYQENRDKVQQEIAKLSEINNKIHHAQTTDFIREFSENFNSFIKDVEDSSLNHQSTLEISEKMIKASSQARQELAQLATTMSGTLTDFINQGQPQESRQYAANMARVTEVLEGSASALQTMLIAREKNDTQGLQNANKEFEKTLQDMKEIRQYLLLEECRIMFDKVSQSLLDFSNLSRDLIAHLIKEEELSKSRISTWANCFQLSSVYSEAVRQDSTAILQQNVAMMTAASQRSFILQGLVFVVGIILAVSITRMIVGPLQKTVAFAQAVAKGNLDKTLNVYSADETGQTAEALRSMVASLKQHIQSAEAKSLEAEQKGQEATMAMREAQEAQKRAEKAKRAGMLSAAEQLEDVVHMLSSASTQLSAQIEQSDHSAQEAAARLAEASTAMNEMNATVQEVARSAADASKISSDTKVKAENGATIVHHSLDSIGHVHQVSSVLIQDMTQLNEHAQSISDIMNVISDIADQTNLLALNAAIEAARAGEAGRGFAVVADEVRKLAEKTMSSTADVGNAIQAIQESTAQSMASLDKAVQQLAESTEYANQSGKALQDIVNDAEATADQVRAIATAAEEQSAASDEINRSIFHINDVVAHTAAAMGEASQAVSSLASQAQTLSTLIDNMKRG